MGTELSSWAWHTLIPGPSPAGQEKGGVWLDDGL
jgi:hypothetical protein